MHRARIAVPAAITPPQPHAFPLLATLAPVAISVLIWFATRSPFALMFAALGPAVAVASVADARFQSRRQSRSERERFARELEAARVDVRAFHDAERRELDLDAPSAAARLCRGDHDPERWAATMAEAALTVGRGSRRSSIDLEVPVSRGEEAEALVALETLAHRLDDAPVTVAASLGIAVVGPPALTAPVARGLVLQLAALLPPGRAAVALHSAPPEGHWLRALPHRLVVDPALRSGELAFRDGVAGEVVEDAVVAVGRSVDAVPSRARVVLRVGATAAIERHPDRALCGPIVAEYIAAEQARDWAERLAGLASVAGAATLPDAVPLAPRLAPGAAPTTGLGAPIGMGADGPRTVDLVAHGPHAIVGGTTGSGKSELLVSWVLALAAAHPPNRVTFLLVDFKGGASFAPIEHIPHCVGVISDLDERSALRALESLRAEVRHRERTLAGARARSIDELDDPLPRLVIVVDEFATMVNDYPDLHGLFADLAARGRSLGLHLVLCTQRPAGAVRDAVLANAGLRISLRVNNPADSRAVIGTDAAAALAPTPLGRALVSVAGDQPREVQVPMASPADAATVTARWPALPAPRRPWCEPLPDVLPTRSLPAGHGIRFGLADHPHEQAQPVASWRPGTDGHVLVIGGSRSGKSGFLRAVASAEPAARLVPPDPERAWDVVFAARAAIRAGTTAAGTVGGVLLLDDLDALVSRYADEHADAFIDALGAVLREGPARGVHLALTTQRITPALHAIVSLCDERLLLRMPTRQDHVIAGGASDAFDPGAPPGRGSWRDHPVQVAHAPDARAPEAPGVETITLSPPFAVVTTSPRAAAERARALGASVVPIAPGATAAGATVVVGDPDAWQACWGALQALNATVPVLFDGVSLADYRMLARSRSLPPPILTSVGAGWLLLPDGRVARGTF